MAKTSDIKAQSQPVGVRKTPYETDRVNFCTPHNYHKTNLTKKDYSFASAYFKSSLTYIRCFFYFTL